MNKKGQTLILFVVLLPIFLLLMAFVVDTGLILQENTKCKSTLKTIIKTTYNNRYEENYQEQIKELVEKNVLPTDNLIIEVQDDVVGLQNTYEKESIFGAIIGIKEYKIKVSVKGKVENGTFKIIKE